MALSPDLALIRPRHLLSALITFHFRLHALQIIKQRTATVLKPSIATDYNIPIISPQRSIPSIAFIIFVLVLFFFARWVLLKNVHLAPQWLVTLEKKLHTLTPHPGFRLFMTMEINPKVILMVKLTVY